MLTKTARVTNSGGTSDAEITLEVRVDGSAETIMLHFEITTRVNTLVDGDLKLGTLFTRVGDSSEISVPVEVAVVEYLIQQYPEQVTILVW